MRNPFSVFVNLLSRNTWMQRATIVLLGISLGTIAREVFPPNGYGGLKRPMTEEEKRRFFNEQLLPATDDSKAADKGK